MAKDLAEFVDGRKVFSVIGRLYPDKGHRFFFFFFARVRDKHPRVAALIVGDGPERAAIQQSIAKLGLNGCVNMTGFREDMDSIYELTDFLVIPSLTEGLPYTLLEAMAAGIPVIATGVGDIPLLIEDRVTGVLVSPGSETALQSAMDLMLSDPEKRKGMTEKARQKILAEFSRERMLRSAEEMYASLLWKAN